MNETIGITLAVVGFIVLAHLIASCKWADKPRPEDDDDPWDVQI